MTVCRGEIIMSGMKGSVFIHVFTPCIYFKSSQPAVSSVQ